MLSRPSSEAAELFEPRGAVAAEDANGLLDGEAIVAGGHGRVRGEDALAAHLLDVGLGGSRRADRRPTGFQAAPG